MPHPAAVAVSHHSVMAIGGHELWVVGGTVYPASILTLTLSDGWTNKGWIPIHLEEGVIVLANA